MINACKNLIKRVKALLFDEQEKSDSALPASCYYLSEDEILCLPRSLGDSRYPYSQDGLNLWAYSSGNIKVEESTFNIFLDAIGAKEPTVCFFAGIKTNEGFFPISITGAAKLPFEKEVLRYTVFTPTAAYYFAETPFFTACVRMFVDEAKSLRFSLCLINHSNESIDSYLSAYFNPFMRHAYGEDIGTKFFKSCQATADGYLFTVREDINRHEHLEHIACIVRDKNNNAHTTTSQRIFCGGSQNQINCSIALQKGSFDEQKNYTEFTDNAVAADILPIALKKGESYEISYTMSVSNDKNKAVPHAHIHHKTEEIDLLLERQNPIGTDIPQFELSGNQPPQISDKILHCFLKNVFRQTEFCARAKNYGGALIGIRDIFQQLEAALLWIPEYCRSKILEALNFIGEDGRAPRQYSYPSSKNTLPQMDLRPFIDQGVWIISTVYTYLAYTNDFSILDEVCGYYKFNGSKVDFSQESDTVLEHLLRIAEYLISNLDQDTGCLHALFGDWNDALDGLGTTKDKDKEYGSGVSVMASLQLYRNLNELATILYRLKKENEAIRYESIAKKLRVSLETYAVEKNEKGDRKILHGWGDKRVYKIASFSDNDGKNRDGLTSNAFWIISGMIDGTEELKKDILEAYHRLESKYGLKTFEPYFSRDNTGVGRIINLPKGTAENGATYIHATMFAIWSLFEIGEAEKAWEQLIKVLPLTHTRVSTSPFVMSNSYSYDPEKDFDGESMNDWFTGSGCVLIKILVWYIFGIKADLDGVRICPSRLLPFNKTSITLHIQGGTLTVDYRKTGKNERTFEWGNQPVSSTYNEKLHAPQIYIPKEKIANNHIQIAICD